MFEARMDLSRLIDIVYQMANAINRQQNELSEIKRMVERMI